MLSHTAMTHPSKYCLLLLLFGVYLALLFQMSDFFVPTHPWRDMSQSSPLAAIRQPSVLHSLFSFPPCHEKERKNLTFCWSILYFIRRGVAFHWVVFQLPSKVVEFPEGKSPMTVSRRQSILKHLVTQCHIKWYIRMCHTKARLACRFYDRKLMLQ